MADKMCENNQVTIMGEIVSDFSYSHEVYGEGFYMVEVSVHRLSSFVDYIPVMVSERLVNVQESAEGKCVYITGQFRSFNRHEEHKNRLVLSVFAREFELVEQFEEENAANQIFLDGFICWGRNARFASGFEVGSHVQIWGRIQSREYVKKVSETQVEQRVAYEVSVSKIEFLE